MYQALSIKKLVVKTETELRLLPMQDILYCEGEGSYSIIHTVDNKKFVISKYLKEIEEELTKNNFFRLHKKFIINLEYLDYIKKSNQQSIAVLRNGKSIPIAFRRVASLKRTVNVEV